MRVTIDQVRKPAVYIVTSIIIILIICFSPLTGVSKPMNQQIQTLPNPYGYFGYEYATSSSGKDIIEIEYLPYLNFSLQPGVGPLYYMTLYLDLGTGGLVHLPLHVKVTFAITGLRNTSRYTIANGTQHFVSQSSYWSYLPDDFVSITTLGLDTSSYTTVKPFSGSSNDSYGNWTDFGIFSSHGSPVQGITPIPFLTNSTLASTYFTGITKNISSTSFERTTIQQFKFKVVLQWEDQIAGVIGISGGSKTLYLGQGESVTDLNAIRLLQST